MHDVVCVQLFQTEEELLHHQLELGQLYLDFLEVAVLQHAAEVELALLEDQEEVRLVLVLLFWLGVDDLDQPHDVFALQPLEDLDLAQGCDGETLVVVFDEDLFHGEEVVLVLVCALPHLLDHALGALSKFVHDFVLLAGVVLEGPRECVLVRPFGLSKRED